MLMAKILAICSGLAHFAAYVDYNRKILSGKTGPNGATWAIWSAIALVSVSTYLSASGDIWKCVIPFTNILLCTGTFVLALRCGKFQKLDVTDWCSLSLGIVATCIWKLSTAAFANVVVQLAVVIGFIPTWRAVLQDSLREQPRPWWLWSTAYCFALTVVLLRWRNQWIDLLYPGISILLHTSVALMALAQRRRLQPQMTAPVFAANETL